MLSAGRQISRLLPQSALRTTLHHTQLYTSNLRAGSRLLPSLKITNGPLSVGGQTLRAFGARNAPPEPPPTETITDDYWTKRRDSLHRPLSGGIPADATFKTVVRALAGNTTIMLAKLFAFLQSGSASMLAEVVHTLADTGNQVLLLMGIRAAQKAPDRNHQYGYGRAMFFYALVSAVGMFWLGGGVTMLHGVSTLMNPPPSLELGPLTWSVLGLSLGLDGGVLFTAIKEVRKAVAATNARLPPDRQIGFFQFVRDMKDPMMLAVLVEDLGATLGVLIAALGIGLTKVTGNMMWDGVASILIGMMLSGMAISLVGMNKRFLLGQAVDQDIVQSIRSLIQQRASVDAVYGVQSRWEGPSTFAYKAEIDFSGMYFAAQLRRNYLERFSGASRPEIAEIMDEYTEDVTRLIETEVHIIRRMIRERHPGAAFIELQPHSTAVQQKLYEMLLTQISEDAVSDDDGKKADIDDTKDSDNGGDGDATTTGTTEGSAKPKSLEDDSEISNVTPGWR